MEDPQGLDISQYTEALRLEFNGRLKHLLELFPKIRIQRQLAFEGFVLEKIAEMQSSIFELERKFAGKNGQYSKSPK